MVRPNENSLKSLLRSTEGLHLTSYLKNTGGTESLVKQLQESIEEANETLRPILDSDERKSFLLPLRKLLSESKLLNSFKGNLGIFRTEDTFRVLSIPIDVHPITVVASSFHVKPILKWIQVDQNFLLLRLENNSASLYWGSHSRSNLIDKINFPESMRRLPVADTSVETRLQRQIVLDLESTLEWLNEKIYEVTNKNGLPLFISGNHEYAKHFMLKLRYPHLRKQLVHDTASNRPAIDAIREIRKTLLEESQLAIESAIREFQWAESFKLGKRISLKSPKPLFKEELRR
ncbi:MAG: hypothetical protein R2827_06870 [Bdellovibrionales bacterium]